MSVTPRASEEGWPKHATTIPLKEQANGAQQLTQQQPRIFRNNLMHYVSNCKLLRDYFRLIMEDEVIKDHCYHDLCGWTCGYEMVSLDAGNGLITDWDKFVGVSIIDLDLQKFKVEDSVTDISETLVISFYIPGLKQSLQRELLVAKLTSLGDAFLLARVTQTRLEDQSTASVVSKAAGTNGGTQYQRPTSFVRIPTPPKTTINLNGKPLTIKWISPAERQESLSKGLCFNCDNKWVRGHKCPSKFLLMMAEDEVDAKPIADEDVMETWDIFILNSLIGHGSPQSLRMWGTLGIGQVHILIDNKRVEYGSYLYVLPMKGPDIVLEIQWLPKLGKTKEVYKVYELYNLASHEDEQEHAQLATSSKHPKIAKLLSQFALLFQVPSTLPPHRSIDNRIHLLPNTKPINLRPYWYPHYQKGKMEKLVNEMLIQRIIRISQIRFSSPVLLVKKKDHSYRFFVDYRALNEVKVKEKFLIPTTDEMFDELGGATIFNKLDLHADYHQIGVHERDVYKTTFCTHGEHYEFLVMPFGLTNASSTFQATMNRLFSLYLCKFVIIFFNDILIYSATLTAHLEHLQCVFQCLHDHQFYVKQSKVYVRGYVARILGTHYYGKWRQDGSKESSGHSGMARTYNAAAYTRVFRTC
ncbi:retrotransposon-related protein, partial [Tanacetum coccineum]